MRRHVSVGLAVLALTVFGSAATASMCNKREMFVVQLAEKYQEQIAARGLQSSERLLEIFTSRETGSFTVLLTRPDGISCVLATGTNWVEAQSVALKRGVEG